MRPFQAASKNSWKGLQHGVSGYRSVHPMDLYTSTALGSARNVERDRPFPHSKPSEWNQRGQPLTSSGWQKDTTLVDSGKIIVGGSGVF